MGLKFYLICLAFLFISLRHASAQYYGLSFAGHDVIQEKRTGLDLSPTEPLCFDNSFELSFDLSFMTGYSDYFGYIFRIVDQDKRNIDLIYDKRFLENKHLKLIIGDKVSDIAFDIKIDKLYKNWYNLKLKFDREHQELVLSAEGKIYTQKISLKKNCYKIFFGAGNYKEHEVKDVPPMKLREVKIAEDGKTTYHWPLNENSGLSPEELIGGHNAGVINPIWIKRMHHDWELVKTTSVSGAASVAFDPTEEKLLLITENSLLTYHVPSRKTVIVPYTSGKQPLFPGNQSLYDTTTKGIVSFFIDQKIVSTFNFNSSSWDKKYTATDIPTNFWHPNKFYSPSDSSLYMIGGYGHYMYKKDVQRYNFNKNEWSSVQTSGEFTPRYLAALGTSKDGAYILGGYGSTTGQQILNPKNIYDLTFFDVKRKTFKKLFELAPKEDEFAFANSMVINEKERTYYALTFTNHIYNSSLGLIRGSLDSPSYEFVGNRIPYTFHDIHSFADLYYCPISKRFVAVLLFHDQKTNESSVNIYTLYAPPEAYITNTAQLSVFKTKWYLIFPALLLIAVLYLVYKRRKKRATNAAAASKMPLSANRAEPIRTKEEATEDSYEYDELELKAVIRNSIFLFGDLQLFDRDGKDITKQFTPLIKELFLIILLFTIRWERGVSSEKLEELLWFDKSTDSARNNRSVSITKLKTILESMDDFQISKETGYWKMIFDHTKVKIDYKEYQNIVKSKTEISKDKIKSLTKIIYRGNFLSNAEYTWLDPLKYEVSNEIIDTYLHTAAGIKITEDPEFLISLANCVFNFDTMNEEAMAIKCKALVFLGKHSLAKSTFESFNKEYKVLYGESFNKSFQEILD